MSEGQAAKILDRLLPIMSRGCVCGSFGCVEAERIAAGKLFDILSWHTQLSSDHPQYKTKDEVEKALADFMINFPPPKPLYDSHRMSENDRRMWEGLRAPVIATSVSYSVSHLAQKYGFSNEEAEAVMGYVKPDDGHRINTLLATQSINRFASENGIRFEDAFEVFREGY